MPSDSNDDSYGPALPPGLSKPPSIKSNTDTAEKSKIGPQLPPHLLNQLSQQDSDQENEDDSSNGPTHSPSCVGPTLPNDLSNKNDDSEEEIIGPCLPSANTHINSAAENFDRRAKAMKDKLTKPKETKVEREEWMLELPPEKSNLFGLGPRQFSKKEKNLGDRSVWTETPNDRNKNKKPKISDKEVIEARVASMRDSEIDKALSEYSAGKSKESLLELHQKKLHKTQDEQPAERRPFDRDRDLGITSFDPVKKRKIIDSSQELNSRFSSGSQQYL